MSNVRHITVDTLNLKVPFFWLRIRKLFIFPSKALIVNLNVNF